MLSFDQETPDSDDLDDEQKHALWLEALEEFGWITGCPQTWAKDCNAILALWALGSRMEFLKLHIRICDHCRAMVAGTEQPTSHPKPRFRIEMMGLPSLPKSNGKHMPTPPSASSVEPVQAPAKPDCLAETAAKSVSPAPVRRFRRRALLAACIGIGALLPLFLISRWTGILTYLFPETQQSVHSEAAKVQSGGVNYVNSVMSGTDEVAKHTLIMTVWQLQLSSYYTSLAPGLTSPDLSTRQAVIAVYQSVPSSYLTPIQASISAACNAEADVSLRARLAAILSSLSQ